MKLATVGGRLGPRAVAFALVALAVGVPAAALRLACAGRSCDEGATASSEAPFCSLPPEVRDLIRSGYYEGRSPDLVGVTGRVAVTGSAGQERANRAWPSTEDDAGRVPMFLWGTGVRPGAAVPPGTGLDDVAPTLAEIVALERPHPGVRSGDALPVVSGESSPRLLVLIVYKDVGSSEFERSGAVSALQALAAEGAGTLEAEVGSLPRDPAAGVTTIGTGGLPHQHGVTGSLTRDPDGELVAAWSKDAPPSVIATLGDHLDEIHGGKPVIGLAGSDVSDRGAIGGTWYGGDDDDVVSLDRRGSVAAITHDATRALRTRGFGDDDVPDLLAVVLPGAVDGAERVVETLDRAARRATGGSTTFVFTATGSSAPEPGVGTLPARRLVQKVEAAVPGERSMVEASALGGLFVDRRAQERAGVDDDVILRALLRVTDDGGARAMADAFPGFAVSLARYC